MEERQITNRACGHILTNANVWSPDGQWIVYDTRSDPAGERFDGETIEIVNVATGEVREIYRSQRGARCGVATFSPAANQVAFILGPEDPTDDWRYSACHRQGVMVEVDRPGVASPLDARDLVPPFTPGALRGGSHVHVFSGDGAWVSFTYDDHMLTELDAAESNRLEQNCLQRRGQAHFAPRTPQNEPVPGRFDVNQRNVGVSVLRRAVDVPPGHPRNHSGSAFSVLVTRTVTQPLPGSDEISRAFDDAWVGTNGYLRADGTRQRRAIAFQGQVVTRAGNPIAEAFVVDIPEDVTVACDEPLAGTPTTRPAPPRGTVQRRLTFTADRRYAGLQGPRHWLRSSPDGSRIALLMRDDNGIVQLWTVAPTGGQPTQASRLPFDVTSSFTWCPDGQWLAHTADNSVFATHATSGESRRLTPRGADADAPRPEACVFSPDGRQIAYIRPVHDGTRCWNQLFIITFDVIAFDVIAFDPATTTGRRDR